MLRKIASGGEITDGFRGMVREYKSLAGKYKSDTAKMLKSIEGRLEPRYMLSLRIIFQLYLQIFDRIDPEHGKFTMAELNPTPEEVKENVTACIREFNEERFTIYNLRS